MTRAVLIWPMAGAPGAAHRRSDRFAMISSDQEPDHCQATERAVVTCSTAGGEACFQVLGARRDLDAVPEVLFT
ncbi:hypothetical protein ABT294_35155 [Nonomuraea sp. NPDC000554]|uniref:hypothetical protein n=1 Tax=Nonomuraea sp. NPDC000554 TaxID=3154259 RepID=UPI00332841B2